MRSSDSRTSLLDVYLDACRNESWADEQALIRSGRAEAVSIYPARVSKLLPRIASNRALSLLGWTLSIVWPLLSPLVFLREALRWRSQSRRLTNPAPLPSGKRLWLYFSDAFSALSPGTLQHLQPDAVVTGPLHGATDRFGAVPGLSVYGALAPGDLWAAYGEAIRANIGLIRTLGIRQSTQGYTAFQWFITARILARLFETTQPAEIVFLNHYDRWAILFDHLAPTARHVLIQHGVVYRNLAAPVRIAHLDTVHVYSEDSADRFRRNILAPTSTAEFAHQPASLHYSEPPLAEGHRFRILLIGDPFQSARDAELGLAILRSGLALDLVVKPHPRFSAAPYGVLQQAGASLLLNRDAFPRADLAICGTSTLGVQYETAGCPVIWYKSHSNDEALQIIFKVYQQNKAK